MVLRIGAFVLGLTMAFANGAQSQVVEIRATGSHRPATGDTPESARQLALVDAQTKAVQAAVTRLQGVAEVKALGLSLLQLEAFTSVILELHTEPPATLRGSLNPAEAARRMAGLRKDVEASRAVVWLWSQMQQLQQRIADQTRARGVGNEAAATIAQAQLQNLAALEATHLAARSAAALARTEPSTVGGHTPTAEGKQRARELAQAAITRAPDLPDAHFAMGDVLIWAEDPVAAESEYRKALLGDAASTRGRVKLAEALRMQGKFDESTAELRDVIRVDPAGSAQAHSDLGMILRAEGKLPDSIAAYREAIRLDPSSWDAHNGLAITLANSKQLPEAVAEFREVVRLDPDSAIGYYNLAFALADLDLDVESAAALREVIRINPNHYNARFNLGELFRLEGKYDDSAAQFREYLRLAPNTPQNQRNIGRATRYVKEFGD
jgi:tetratricopeptide (TPR) repeat protein